VSRLSTISLQELRRHVVAWQGFCTRFQRAGDEQIVECVRRLSCVQLDSIATVERSHLLVLGVRVGAVEPKAVSRLLAEGRLFEYWAHQACLVAVEDWPLLGRRRRERHTHHWWGPVIDSDPALAARILKEIEVRGPLGSRHFEGQGGRGMWLLKPAKRMLDSLWTAGKLVVCGRQGFQRLYDLPERVIPASLLKAPVPGAEETLRNLVVRAIGARGALTASGILNHYQLRGRAAQLLPHLNALCRAGLIRELAVSDGGPAVYLPEPCKLGSGQLPAGGVFLSPFENLLWDRDFARRLFGFDHIIEVYKRGHERAYGYYVLPFLVGDKLVGRADLKSHRDESVLRMKAFHCEPGVQRTALLSSRIEGALARLAKTIGLQEVERIDKPRP
jgi:uncharacterized protein